MDAWVDSQSNPQQLGVLEFGLLEDRVKVKVQLPLEVSLPWVV
jgi:hypothetical protein